MASKEHGPIVEILVGRAFLVQEENIFCCAVACALQYNFSLNFHKSFDS